MKKLVAFYSRADENYVNGTIVSLEKGNTEVAADIIQKLTGSYHEYLEGPAIIEPYSLFGMYPYYTADYTAETDCCVVTIEKTFVLDELSKYDVFKMNFYNMLSNRAQSMRKRLLVTHGGSTQEKIIAFLKQRCDRPEGKKVLCIKMEMLAALINDTRLNVSKALKEFQEKDLIKVNRKIFTIPNFEQLIASYE